MTTRTVGRAAVYLHAHTAWAAWCRVRQYVSLLPTLGALSVWNYHPLIFPLELSFHRLDARSPKLMWIGLDNYRELFAAPVFRQGWPKGHTVTSWPSLQTVLRNAGARWEDESVVVDVRLVTSRKPDDLPDFCREMLKLFGQAAKRQAA